MYSTPENARFVTSSDGSRIYADATGDPTKPSIVFIHGLTLSAAIFNSIFANETYKKSFFLVRYDMRGHGRSVKPVDITGYTSQLYADDFEAVKNSFKLRKPIVVGWSMGATVVADICSFLPSDAISGAVYLAALPYIGPIMAKVGTPTIMGFLPGLTCEDSVSTSVKTLSEFADSLFVDPSVIPWEMKASWIGMAACQTPNDRKLILSRPQDPTKLFERAAQGLPLLIVNGRSDNQVLGNVVVEEMGPHFKDLEVVTIEKNGSHAVLFENEAEVMSSIVAFAKRVKAT